MILNKVSSCYKNRESNAKSGSNCLNYNRKKMEKQ